MTDLSFVGVFGDEQNFQLFQAALTVCLALTQLLFGKLLEVGVKRGGQQLLCLVDTGLRRLVFAILFNDGGRAI